MILYELMGQLKDAGFIFEKVPTRNGTEILGRAVVHFEGDEPYIEYWMPTLEKLIEACGESFGKLEASNAFGKTQFIALEAHPQTIPVMFYVESPTEAVAKLWMALHKKPCVDKPVDSG